MKRFVVVAAALACLASPSWAQDETPAPAPAPAEAAPSEFCGVLSRTDEAEAFVPAPGYSVLSGTLPLAPPQVEDHIDAIVCVRPSIYLGPNDYRVLTDLRVPLYIRDTDRLAVLEMVGQQLRVRFTLGQPTQEEADAMAAAIDRAHDAMASAG